MRKGLAARLAELGLAEQPSEDDPLWIQHAYELRTQRLWSYQKIADALDQPYRRIYKALNRERVRKWDSECDKRNRAARTEKDLAYRRKLAPFCSRCGAQLSGPSPIDAPMCGACREVVAEERFALISELWAMGWSHREIGEAIGKSREWVGAAIGNMRKAGWDLPRRDTTGKAIDGATS